MSHEKKWKRIADLTDELGQLRKRIAELNAEHSRLLMLATKPIKRRAKR